MGTAEEVVLLGGSAAAPSLLLLWGQIWQPRGWAGGVCGVWPNHPGYSQTPAWTTPNFGGTASSRLYHTGGDAGVTAGPLGTARSGGGGRRG